MKQHMGSTEPFPANVYEFARNENLGIPISEYRWGFSCLEALLILPLGGWPILTVVILPHMLSASLSNLLAGLPGLLIILALDIACIWYYVTCFRRSFSWRIYIFTHGFAYFKGPKRDVFRWEEIRDIEEKVSANQYGQPLFFFYRVKRSDGHRISFDYHFRGVRNLAAAIRQGIQEARVAADLKRFRAGEVIDFGAIQLSRQGVSFRDQLLPWELVKEIALDLGTRNKVSTAYVRIRSKDEKSSSGALISIKEVKSVSLLIALVGEIFKHPEQD